MISNFDTASFLNKQYKIFRLSNGFITYYTQGLRK